MPGLRIPIALLALVGAVFVHYRLGNIPLPIEVERAPVRFTPVSAALINNEALVIAQPARQHTSTNVSPQLLFSDEGKDVVTVEARFESARLGDDINDLLRRELPKRPLPNEGMQPVVYATEGDEETAAAVQLPQTDERAEPCRTAISIMLVNTAVPSEIHFSQTMGPGSDRYRYFEMKAVSADLMVQLLTRNFEGNTQAPGCRKTLLVGQWSRTFSSPVPLNIVVAAGTSFRFSFTPLAGRTPWTETSGTFEPFALEGVPLVASSLRKISVGISPPGADLFNASSLTGAQPLLLKHLLVGADEVKLDFSGKAMVQENGKFVVTFDLLEFAYKNKILAGILGILDIALLGWVKRMLFFKPKSPAGFVLTNRLPRRK